MTEEDGVGCQAEACGTKLRHRHRAEFAVNEVYFVTVVDERAADREQAQRRQVVVGNAAADRRMWHVDQQNAHRWTLRPHEAPNACSAGSGCKPPSRQQYDARRPPWPGRQPSTRWAPREAGASTDAHFVDQRATSFDRKPDFPDDHLPPLGLLAIGGPLLDDGHEVRLIDGEFGPIPIPSLVEQAVRLAPDAVLFGHSGSTSGHPVIASVALAIAAAMPSVHIVYGGVFPTYHWREILSEEPYVTAIVRGEGEETARRLMSALQDGRKHKWRV